MGVRCTCQEQPILVKHIERGGLLLRGNAPTLRIDSSGRLVVEQRCPACKRLTTYSPLTLRIGSEEPHADPT